MVMATEAATEWKVNKRRIRNYTSVPNHISTEYSRAVGFAQNVNQDDNLT
jgi:hypothetical protein